MLGISGKDYSITFATYFNVEWNEQRLNMNPEFGAEFATPNSTDVSDAMVPMGLEFINGLWVPNIFIYNLKTYKVISVLNKLAGLWISPNKQVLYRKASYCVEPTTFEIKTFLHGGQLLIECNFIRAIEEMWFLEMQSQ